MYKKPQDDNQRFTEEFLTQEKFNLTDVGDLNKRKKKELKLCISTLRIQS